MRYITKRFGDVVANDNVNLDVYAGEVLAILGENGCGKTTLMNMVSGIYYPDEGQIFVNGEEVVIRSPKDAFDLRIGMIHQHFKLIDIFTAAENIILGIEDGSGYDMKKVTSRVTEIAERYGFSIDPKKKIYEMSVSEKQTVEILKVLYRGVDTLILDEPTAVLTLQEIERLFSVLRRMVQDGKSVIIITHKLHEVLEVSDRVAIMRKGALIATVNTDETDEHSLTEMMVGKKVSLDIDRSEPLTSEPRLVIERLNVYDIEGAHILKDVSLSVNGGEILGIAGIAGSGQKELLEAVAGLQRIESGNIIFHNPKRNQPVTFFHKNIKQIRTLAAEGKFQDRDGKPMRLEGKSDREITQLVQKEQILFIENEIFNLRSLTPLEIRDLGVKLSFVPEDRLGMGLVGNMNIIDNMLLRSYRKGKGAMLNREKPSELAETIVKELNVVTSSLKTRVRSLSGGNVQKLLVGREISSSPKVLMTAYPVRGLDINSSYTIYRLLDAQKRLGSAVIFVGEDLDVLMALCDRIAVLNSGAVTGIVDARTVTKEELGSLMIKTQAGKERGTA
ncbi:MAG: ABC transporter ATP-binding protein [Christensenellales bacterium]